MALQWKWDNQIGELVVRQVLRKKDGTTESEQEYTKTLYEGNAFLIMLNEWEDSDTGESMYSMYSFFVDENHAKNCLGLTKNYSNIFKDGITEITRIRLNKAKSRNWKKIVTLFAQAFDRIIIELYTEEDKNDNNDS